MSETDSQRAPGGQGESTRRILVITYGEFSGIRTNLLAALRRRGCDVVEIPHSLRFLRFRFAYLALMFVNAVLVYGKNYRRHMNRTWAAQWARGRANQKAVERWDDVDAVISLNPMPNHTARRPGVTYAIFTDHVNLLSKQAPDYGLDLPERQVSGAWNRYERRALQAQDRVLLPSRYVARSVTDDYGVDPARVRVVGVGPNQDVDCLRDGVEKNYRRRNVLFVGLEPERKGLPILLRAFEKVVTDYPDARLDVVGVDGECTEHVRYHGRVAGTGLKELFYRSQVFAMPTLREPFGIVFLEAMWSKVVCIGTNAFAIPELIEDGATGYLVPACDEAKLAERIAALFADPERMRRMADAGYQCARRNWSWDLAAGRILDALFDEKGNRHESDDYESDD